MQKLRNGVEKRKFLLYTNNVLLSCARLDSSSWAVNCAYIYICSGKDIICGNYDSSRT